ncbi:MAG: AbrB/MazE/SpoVT family DNA-binding domain-containing protein [Patescibacteria group bacterium]
MFEQKLYKNGSSIVVTVPKQLLRKNNLRDGSDVIVDSGPAGIGILIKPQGKAKRIKKETTSLTPEFKEWLDTLSSEEEKLICELAKR